MFEIKRFTANGYAHKNLKEEAKNVRRQQEISHRAALDIVARDIGYDSWNNLLNEEVIKKRDIFFTISFKHNSPLRAEFTEICKNNGKTNNTSEYRNFLLIRWSDTEARALSVMTHQQFYEHPSTQLDSNYEKFLPQNLPDDVLETMLYLYDQIDYHDDDESISFSRLISIVVSLYLAAKSAKQGDLELEVEMTTSEIIDLVSMYNDRLALEEISRKTDIEVVPALLEELFSTSSSIKFRQKLL